MQPQSVFCSRDAEMSLLESAFLKVRGSQEGLSEPQLVVLLAESGLGKTRIAQEFFSRLSGTYDPDHYWPSRLGHRGSNLQINPDPKDCDNKAAIPFLWWGLRLSDPGAHDDLAAGAIYPQLKFLAPHLEPIYDARRRKERLKEFGKTAVGAGADAVTGGMSSAVGFAVTGAKFVFETVRLIKDDATDRSRQTPGELAEQIERSMVDRLLSDFELILQSPGPRIPAVILLDDAQFSRNDLGLCDFVQKLIARAWASSWPLLIVVSQWEKPWHEDYRALRRSIAQVIADASTLLGEDWKPFTLQPASDLTPMLQAALPGLTTATRHAILDRAEGIPAYLEEMVRLCELRLGYFEDRDRSKNLTIDGLQALLEEASSFLMLIEARMLGPETPLAVREAVTLSSLQGVQFVCKLTQRIAEGLDLGGAANGLAQAELPHSFIHGVDSGIAEFKLRVIHDVARRSLRHVVDEAVAERKFRDVLRRTIEDRHELLGQRSEELEVESLICANVLERSTDASERALARTALGDLAYLYLSRQRLEDATAVYERLLATEPSPESPTELSSRIKTLRFLARAYRKLNWPSRRSRALKKMIWLAYHPISDDGRIIAFARDRADAERYFEDWKEKTVARWKAEVGAGADVNRMNHVATEIYRGSAPVIVEGLLGLSELARAWPNLSFDEGDDPVDKAPFMVTTSVVDADRKSVQDTTPDVAISIAMFMMERAYNLGAILGESFAERMHVDLLNDLATDAEREGRYDEAESGLQRALSVALASGDEVYALRALNNLTHVAGRRDNHQAAVDYLQRAQALVHAMEAEGTFGIIIDDDDDDGLRRELRVQIPTRWRKEFEREPRRILDRFRALKSIEGNLKGNAGVLAQRRNDFNAAKTAYKEAFEIHNAPFVGDVSAAAEGLLNLIAIARAEGDKLSECSYWAERLGLLRGLKSRGSELMQRHWSAEIETAERLMRESGCEVPQT
jgi:tetratricopeptide (TPR) repeat protein